MKIAVTGHIAAGKSTVMKILTNLAPNFFFISADDVAKKVRNRAEVKELIMAEHGTLEPALLRPFVKTSKSLAYVTQLIRERIAADTAKYQNSIVEVPTLLQAYPDVLPYDCVIFITAKEELRIARMKERGYSDEAISGFIEAQTFATSDVRINYVIHNDGNCDELLKNCERIMSLIMARKFVEHL